MTTYPSEVRSSDRCGTLAIDMTEGTEKKEETKIKIISPLVN